MFFLIHPEHKLKQKTNPMKRILITSVIILLIFEILMFPKDAMSYAAMGLTLWFDNMIPALFPFMVISGLAIRLDIAPYIISVLHPLLFRIFRTNVYSEYAIVMGFLCGYPMGAIIIRDLLHENKITQRQAEYLLSFCNNIGPVFFCSLVLPLFPGHHPLLIFGMYGIPFIYGIFMRYTFYKKAFNACSYGLSGKQQYQMHKTTQDELPEFATAFSDALNQAVSSSLFLGACMIFFNMLRFLPAHFIQDKIFLQALISWLLEVNGAISFTGDLYANNHIATALCLLPMLSIGGLSCMCQTMGILNTTMCNIKIHFMHKSLQAVLWLILTLLLLLM